MWKVPKTQGGHLNFSAISLPCTAITVPVQMHIIEDCRDSVREVFLISLPSVPTPPMFSCYLLYWCYAFLLLRYFFTHEHCKSFRCVAETGDGEKDYIADDEKCWEDRTGAWEDSYLSRSLQWYGGLCFRKGVCTVWRRYRVGVVCYKGRNTWYGIVCNVPV